MVEGEAQRPAGPARLPAFGAGAFALLGGLFGLLVWAHAPSGAAYDDSYFFIRFARNALDHGLWAWNPADGPVHGCTSQLYMLWTAPVVAIWPAHAIFALRAGNVLLWWGAAQLAFRFVRRRRPPGAGGEALLWVFLLMASVPLASAMGTGMESALTMLCLVGACERMVPVREGAAPAAGELESLVWVLLVYLARPDAALVPALLWLGPGGERPRWRRALGLGLVLGVWWSLAWAYYGTALPLSFHMKTIALGHYDAEVVALGRGVKLAHFALFAFVVFPFALAGLGGLRERAASSHLRWLALAGAAAATYHFVATNEIMGYRARFYLPALLALGLAFIAGGSGTREPSSVRRGLAGMLLGLVAAALAQHFGLLPGDSSDPDQAVPGVALAGFGAAALLAVLMPVLTHRRARSLATGLGAGLGVAAIIGGWLWAWPPAAPRIDPDAEILARQQRKLSSLRGLEALVECLPPDITVHHSEMGVLGMRLPEARLVDLVGILSAETGVEGRSFEAVCEADPPEAIFLPHRNYAQLNAEVRAAPCFADYARVIARGSAPLHLRRDLLGPFMQCRRASEKARRSGQ